MLSEMSYDQRCAAHARGKEIICRLYDVSKYLPDDLAVLRAMADRLYCEGPSHFGHLACEMGYLVLKLARPAIPEDDAKVIALGVADQIDILLTQIEAGIVPAGSVPVSEIDEDDIPY